MKKFILQDRVLRIIIATAMIIIFAVPIAWYFSPQGKLEMEKLHWLDYNFTDCSQDNVGEYFSGGWNITNTSLNPDFSKDFFPLVNNRHEIDYVVQKCIGRALSKEELLQIVGVEIGMVQNGPWRYRYSDESLPRLESIKHIIETQYE